MTPETHAAVVEFRALAAEQLAALRSLPEVAQQHPLAEALDAMLTAADVLLGAVLTEEHPQ